MVSILPESRIRLQMRVLALDGGGIRGIVSLLILKEIEQILDKPIQDLFDYCIGTSTGAIIASGLTVTDNENYLYTTNDLIHLFEDNYRSIFPQDGNVSASSWFFSKYQNDGLEQILYKFFKNKTLDNCKKTILLTAYDVSNNQPFYFTNNKRIEVGCMDDYFGQTTIKDACLASAAAPTYFPTKVFQRGNNESIHLVDGGIFMNSPSLPALLDLLVNKPNTSVKILSIGTGYGQFSVKGTEPKNWGKIPWMWQQRIFKLMMDGSKSHAHIFSSKILKNDFFRIDPVLNSNHLAMDKFSNLTMKSWQSSVHQVFGSIGFKERILNFYKEK